MELSIVVPTYNNFKYLKLFCKSLKENSNYNHQIIFHINNGSDGTLEFIKKNNFSYTISENNIGLCSSINKASVLVKNNFILYAHDDMYFCKNWDLILEKSINDEKNNLFYLSGTNVSHKDGLLNYDCGDSPENFDHRKFDKFCNDDKSLDLQGSHWAPHVFHKDLWNKIGGFSTEFDPGDASDPDICMKLWIEGVRTFKCISKFKVYHFGSVTTRKKNININNGTKKFILKYGFNPRFFRKYYLRGDEKKKFQGPLEEPQISIQMLIDLFINKMKYFYFKLF
tara:strand:+ start:943 stop:1791 length:849 start_codon:yes stop_codon:yes gene_type:complete